MKFKPASWSKWSPAQVWRASMARKQAKKARASLDSIFPLCFVPESSGPRREGV
jgi:hypothetical protein